MQPDRLQIILSKWGYAMNIPPSKDHFAVDATAIFLPGTWSNACPAALHSMC